MRRLPVFPLLVLGLLAAGCATGEWAQKPANQGAPGKEEADDILKYYESASIHISALIVSDYSFDYSHWNATESLDEWLRRNNTPGVYGIDTRALTKRIREKGAMLGKLEPAGSSIDFYDPNKVNLVAEVATRHKKIYGTGSNRIILIDCGVKYNIIRNLLKRDTTIIRIPWDYDYHNEEFDGLFISNGPGDPKMCRETIDVVRRVMARDIPVFGICLGNQILAGRGRRYLQAQVRPPQSKPAVRRGRHQALLHHLPKPRVRRRRPEPAQGLAALVHERQRRHQRRHPPRQRPVSERPVPPRGVARSRGHGPPVR